MSQEKRTLLAVSAAMSMLISLMVVPPVALAFVPSTPPNLRQFFGTHHIRQKVEHGIRRDPGNAVEMESKANLPTTVQPKAYRRRRVLHSSRSGHSDRPSQRGRRQRDTFQVDPVASSYYLATCLPGMAGVLRDELISLGCCMDVEVSGTSAVTFGVVKLEAILRVLLWTRTAHKIMELLVSSNDNVALRSRQDVYQFIRRSVPVKDLLMGAGKKNDWLTVSVSVTLNNARYIPDDINHSHYTALNVKNALVDAAREAASDDDSRPSVDTIDADVPLVVVLRGIPPASIIPAPRFSNTRKYANDRGTNSDDTFRGDFSSSNNAMEAQMSLYRCIHTGSLHRRGYRHGSAVHKAAMKESTAAGLLLAAQWQATSRCEKNKMNHATTNGSVDRDATLPLESKERDDRVVLIDPMMGSGTFLIEGAMIAADLAPGLMRIKCDVPASRSPPILRWRNDQHSESEVEGIWNDLLREATSRAKEGLADMKDRIEIIGNDIHGGAFELAEIAVRQAGLSKVINLHCMDCLHWKILLDPNDHDDTSSIISTPPGPWTVVSNPPWGIRLTDDMHESWEALRHFLRETVPRGSEAWILSGSPEATKHLGLRRSQSLPLQTGQQDLRWLQYVIRDRTNVTSNNVEGRADLGFSPDIEFQHPVLRPKLSFDRPKRAPMKTRTRVEAANNEWMI